MDENKLSPEEKQRLIESKKQRFARMNIPTPVAPVLPGSVVNVKDPKMLSRIREIQGGKLKQEFREFDNKVATTNAGHVDMPLPPKKQQGGRQLQNAATAPKKEIPKLEEFSAKPDPFLDGIKDIFSDTPSSSNYGRPTQVDDGGSTFTNQFRSKLHNRLNEKVQTQGQYQNEDYNPGYQAPALQSGMIVLNEEDLKKKIISIAKPIAKQVATEIIKQVFTEYLKKPVPEVKPVVSETSNKVVSTEILPNGKVKINGKIYNISADK